MLVAKILGLFIPRLMNPAFSNAAIALLTLVSISRISSQPAFRAISRAEIVIVERFEVRLLMALQT